MDQEKKMDFELKDNHIYLMDCLEGLKYIPDNYVDAIITDPPYFIENLKKDLRDQSIRGSSKNSVFFNTFDHFESLEHFQDFIKKVLLEFQRVLKPKGQIYFFCSYHHLDWLIKLIKDLDFRFYKPLIWFKPDVMGVFPNNYGCNYEPILWFRKKGDEGVYKNNIGCSQRDVFEFYSTNAKYREECGFHPTPKPVELIRRLIKNCTFENDIVLDAFMGSGTTAVACKNVNRRFIGFENNPDYIKICEERLRQEVLEDWFK